MIAFANPVYKKVHYGGNLAEEEHDKGLLPPPVVNSSPFCALAELPATVSPVGLFTPVISRIVPSEALEAISEAEALVERFDERWWFAELHRLRGAFLAALSAEEAQIEACFLEAIRIAKEQKSVSLEKRAEATYAEHRRQKASR